MFVRILGQHKIPLFYGLLQPLANLAVQGLIAPHDFKICLRIIQHFESVSITPQLSICRY